MDKKLTLLVMFCSMLVACGPSQEDIRNVSTITCNVMGESRNMDAAMRIKEINAAREKIGAAPYLGTDQGIKEAFEHGLCTQLVSNDPSYVKQLAESKALAAERARKEALAEEQRKMRARAEALAEEQRKMRARAEALAEEQRIRAAERARKEALAEKLKLAEEERLAARRAREAALEEERRLAEEIRLAEEKRLAEEPPRIVGATLLAGEDVQLDLECGEFKSPLIGSFRVVFKDSAGALFLDGRICPAKEPLVLTGASASMKNYLFERNVLDAISYSYLMVDGEASMTGKDFRLDLRIGGR